MVVDYGMSRKANKKGINTGGFKLIYKGEKNANGNNKAGN